MLTAQRRDEVARMTWVEITTDLSAWTLPGERAKNGVAHIVPLSPQMRAHLEAQRKAQREREAANDPETEASDELKAGDLVFPGCGGPVLWFREGQSGSRRGLRRVGLAIA